MKREAEAMISEPSFDAFGAARWRNRLENYIKTRCSKFYTPPKIIINALTKEDIKESLKPFDRKRWDENARNELRNWMVLLESLIEMTEAQVEAKKNIG
jgi:hypothetical protein